MTLSPATLLRGLVVLCLTIVWAVLAHYGSTDESHPDFSAAIATAPLAIAAIIVLWRVRNPFIIAAGGLAVLGLLAWSWSYLRQNIALLYYVQHIGTNLALGSLFGHSLFGDRESLVTQFARMAHNGKISPAQARYTRQVTIAWTIFFFLTITISTGLFYFAPPSAWSVFANLLTFPLLIVMFGVEHIVRNRVLPPEDRSSIADTIRGYRAHQHPGATPLTKPP